MRRHNIGYLRVICTNACNLNCEGCHKEGQKIYNEMPATVLYKIISACIGAGIRKVKLIGGEPVMYGDIVALVSNLSRNFPDVDLSMVSNGTAKISHYETLIENGLKRLNISVHGFGEQFFLENTKSNSVTWHRMRNNLQQLLLRGYINKINYVIKKGVNEDDLYDLIDWLSGFSNIRIDVLNFLNLSSLEGNNLYYYSMKEIEELLHKKFGVIHKSIHNNQYSIDSDNIVLGNGLNVNLKKNELGKFGYMNICESCSQKHLCVEGVAAMRLTTDMKLQPCLIRSDHCLNLQQCNGHYDGAISDYFNNI